MARTPKNIRQIGGREDRIKMYMEDYVSTYLHRVQEMQEEVGMAGFLVGTWQQGNTETDDPQKKGIDQGMKQQSTVAEPACVFVSGAMMIHQANLEGGRVYLSQEAWTEGYESLGTYFSGQELCGLFVCEGSCRRFRRQALFAAVRECFPDQEALLYILTEEGEEIVYRIRERSEERLQGYYCYFERNEAMQDYMMDHLPDRRVEWEMPSSHRQRERRMTGGEVSQRSGEASTSKEWNELSYRPQNMRGKEGSLGDPAENFREKMRRQQESKAQQKSGRGIVALCAAMAVVIFVSGLGLAYRERGGVQIKDLLEQLKID
ncbi:MAG: hypothetical protein J6I64_06025, partial [Lachnospiraceae bacterium]|nr:hypothetical protein [Lachnospiraceae bacterium]